MFSSAEYGSSSEKGVRFAPCVNVQRYENGDSDPSSSWYSQSDYKRFRTDRIMDAVRIGGRHPDDLKEKECFWGLENVLVPRLRERVIQVRENIRKGVLAEQKAQRMECRPNPYNISRSSTKHSEWSASVARKKALFYSSQVRITAGI